MLEIPSLGINNLLGFLDAWLLDICFVLVSWFDGLLSLLVSKFLGFKVSWFQSFLASWLLGFKVFGFVIVGLLVSCFQISRFRNDNDSTLPKFPSRVF